MKFSPWLMFEAYDQLLRSITVPYAYHEILSYLVRCPFARACDIGHIQDAIFGQSVDYSF